MPSQNLISDLTVTLGASASTTVSHNLVDSNGSGLVPSEIRPDRSTGIVVSSSNTTSVTFTNNGSASDTAIFRCVVYHSSQAPSVTTLGWQGGSSGSSGASFDSTPITFASANYTLSGSETSKVFLTLGGTTGGSRSLIAPNVADSTFNVLNNTSDIITLRTAAGTGFQIDPGQSVWAQHNGTDYVQRSAPDTGSTGGTVWVSDSTKTSSAYANGLRYVPVSNGANEYVEFQFIPAKSGTAYFDVLYAMSSASGNNVRLRVDSLQLGVSDNPTTAVTVGTATTVTPGNDVNIKRLTSSNVADLALNVTAGNVVKITFNRLGADGADTHLGDLRVIEMRVR